MQFSCYKLQFFFVFFIRVLSFWAKCRNLSQVDRVRVRVRAIMTVKMAAIEPNCFKWEPPVSVLKASKSDTNTYNTHHS